jgi:hypothetical protein
MRRKRPPEVSAGDTFFLAHPYNHLYVVCSDPAMDGENVVLVNVTTFAQEEEACCIINAGEHPFVTRKSCIRYKDARIAAVEAIRKLQDAGKMTSREPVSSNLLARIRDGASESDFLPEGCRRILENQFLI